MKLKGKNETIINTRIVEFFLAFLLEKSLKTSTKSREMLRSVLTTRLLVTVYRAALSVAAPEG